MMTILIKAMKKFYHNLKKILFLQLISTSLIFQSCDFNNGNLPLNLLEDSTIQKEFIKEKDQLFSTNKEQFFLINPEEIVKDFSEKTLTRPIKRRKTVTEFYGQDSYLKKEEEKNNSKFLELSIEDRRLPSVLECNIGLNEGHNFNPKNLPTILSKEKILERITDHLSFFSILKLAATSRELYTLINECREVAKVGIEVEFPRKKMELNVYRKKSSIKHFKSYGPILPKKIPSVAYFRILQYIADPVEHYWKRLSETCVVRLSLNSQSITDESFLYLYKCLLSSKVKNLSLIDNYITDESINKIIGEQRPVNLIEINLTGNQITESAQERLQAAYPSNTILIF